MNLIRKISVLLAGVMACSVLAACNSAPNPDAGKEHDVFQPESSTVTFEKEEEDAEAFTINTTGYGVTHDGFIQVDLTMSNHMEKIVEVNSAEPDDGNLNLLVSAYFDGSYEPVARVSTGKDNLLEQVLNPYTESGMVTTTYSLSGSIFFKEPDEWNVMAVVFSLDNGEDVQEIRFVFNNAQ